MKFRQHFATTFRHLTKTILGLVYQSTFLVHFTMLGLLCITIYNMIFSVTLECLR